MRTTVRKIEHTLGKTSALIKIKGLFFTYPDKEFSLTDIAKELSISKSITSKTIQKLLSREFIILVRLNNIYRIRANLNNPKFKSEKMINNLWSLYELGVVDYLVKHYNHPKAIVLFGSYRYGEDTTDSDIDLAIIGDSIKNAERTTLPALKDTAEYPLKRTLSLHLLPTKLLKENIKFTMELKTKSDKHKSLLLEAGAGEPIIHGIINGIVLSGFLEVF